MINKQFPEIVEGVKLFAKTFTDIGVNGVANKISDDKIEKAQELYLEAWILVLFKASNIPVSKKHEILNDISSKIK